MSNKTSKLPQIFIGTAVFLLVLWLGIKGWRINTAVQSLLAAQAQAETLLANGPTAIDPAQADALVYGVRRDVVTLRQELAFAMPLFTRMGWIPRYGPTLAAAPTLLEMADYGTETAVYAYRSLSPALPIMQSKQDDTIPALLAVLDAAEPDLRAAAQSLDKFIAARSQLPNEESLAWRIRSLLPLLDEWLPRAQDGLQLALILPEMMGSSSPRTLLIVAQNEDELRPTGGFITGAGLAVVENGRIASLTFEDANFVDDYLHKPYALAPGIYKEMMGLDLFFFRDANYWPDFPASAQEMLHLYSYGKDVPMPDGVIAFNQEFMRLLLQATGPITLPGESSPVTAENVIETFQQAWAPDPDTPLRDWVLNRKDFLPVFAQAILDKLQSDFQSIDPQKLVENVFTAVSGKHLLIYMRSQPEAQTLAAIGWDGRLPTTLNHDYLLVVDTNIGYSKANLLVDQAIQHNVTLFQDGAAATTTVTFINKGQPNPDQPNCQSGFGYSQNPTYLDDANNCHYSFLRVYAPVGSTLVEASQTPIPAEVVFTGKAWPGQAFQLTELPGLTTFANVVLVPTQAEASASFTYTLPETAVPQNNDEKSYTLTIAKQPGTRPFPVALTITLPENGRLISATPEPATIEGSTLTFQLTLDRDLEIAVHYK